MIKSTFIGLLCIGICISQYTATISASSNLDDFPWTTIKGLSIGTTHEAYASTFGSKHPPMQMGALKLWPAIFSNNQMTAGVIHNEKVVAIIWTWKQLPEAENQALTLKVFEYLNSQDSSPTKFNTQKVSGERIANVLALSFRLPQLGESTRAIFTASELETTVIIHDGSTPEIEAAINKSNVKSLLKENEQPVTVRDHLAEHLANADTADKQSMNQIQPSLSSGTSVRSHPPGAGLDAKPKLSVRQERGSSTRKIIIVALIMATTVMLWLMVKKRNFK